MAIRKLLFPLRIHIHKQIVQYTDKRKSTANSLQGKNI